MVLLDTACAEPLTDPAPAREPVLCGLPLEAVHRRVLPATDGPLVHLWVQCARGHRYTHVPSLAGPRDDAAAGGAAEAA